MAATFIVGAFIVAAPFLAFIADYIITPYLNGDK